MHQSSSLFICSLLCVTMVACGGSSPSEEKSPESSPVTSSAVPAPNTTSVPAPKRDLKVKAGTNPQADNQLWDAFLSEDVQAMHVALDKGASPEAQYTGEHKEVLAAVQAGLRPLHIVIRAGDLSLVKRMVELGADINAVYEEGGLRETPLSEAVREGEDETVKFLLQSGATVPQDCAVLCRAVDNGMTDVVKLLLENGVAPDEVDWKGYLPLHHAALNNDLQAARLLIEAKSPLDEQTTEGGDGYPGCTPLHFAVKYEKMAALLLEAGANLELRNEEGHTALHTAIFDKQCSPQSIAAMIEAGANVNAIANNSWKYSPLHMTYLRKDAPEVIRILMLAGANPALKNDYGKTVKEFFESSVDDKELLTKMLQALESNP